MCRGLLWTYAVLFIFMLILIVVYNSNKQDSNVKRRSFGAIFTFAVLWGSSLVVYFTDAYFDYMFRAQIILTSLPIFFTFLVTVIVVDNLIRIYLLLCVESVSTLVKLSVYRPIAAFCVLTQVLNPIFALFEQGSTQEEIDAGHYEHNPLYFTRNALTSLAIVLLSVYICLICTLLSQELAKDDLFDGVRQRVILVSLLFGTVLALRLFMIWSQNAFWYSDNQAATWLCFVFFYQLTANILPLVGFLVVVLSQVVKFKKQKQKKPAKV
jgi:hypothetical protein